MTDVDTDETTLGVREVRRRAATGAALVGLRTALIQFVGLAGSVVIARLLVPRDLGIVAFGLTLLTAAQFLSDGGLGATLIRRRHKPTGIELSTLLGLQLVLSGVLVGMVGVVGIWGGEVGLVTLIMTASLPITAMRAPALILLERELEYGAIVLAEVAIAVTLNGWSVVTVLAGWGVWGLATATIVSEAAGTVVMLRARSGGGVIRPRLNMLAVREMIVFGARFQAVTVVLLIRTQAINLGVAAIGGLPALGIWALANRIMRVPFWVFRGLLRVSYPATARLADAGVDLRPVLAKMGRVTAIGAGALLVPLAGTSYVLLPALFGERWASAAIVIPYACAGLIVSGPISVAASGYLYTLNDAATPLRATVANSILWIALTLVLLPYIGSAALGLGWMAGSLVESVVFTVYVRRRVGLNLLRTILPIIAMAVAWSCGGYGLTLVLPEGAAGAVVASVVAGAGFLGGCSIISRADFISVMTTVRDALGRPVGGRRQSS